MVLFIRYSSSIVQTLGRTLCTKTAENIVGKTLMPCFKNHKSNRFSFIIQSDLVINQKLKRNEALDNDHWCAVRKELLTSFDLTDINVDSQIYDICLYYKNYNEAKNYFKFLEKNNYSLNLNLLGCYLKTFYLQNNKITEEEEKEIFRIYDDLRKKYKLLDTKTCSDCIAALSLTKRWKETLDILKMTKLVENRYPATINCIICAAFNNNEPDIGWSILKELVTKITIDNSVYSAYSKYCIRQFKGNKLKRKIEEMFYFWKEYSMVVTEAIVTEYAQAFESLGYSFSKTTISKKGQCCNCKNNMRPIALNPSDFQKLSKVIFKNVIIGSNVHITTSPEELKRYLGFVKTMKPYDIVIDGLNLAYATGRQNNGGTLNNILDIVKYFRANKKRVLVIGRVHMNWWSPSIMNAIKQIADVFLMKNISKDDSFLIHVTLSSGAQTYFMSRDLMRQHKSKLDDKNIQLLFKRWQISRQYKFEKSKPRTPMQIVPPCSFDPTIQQFENGWHIPFTTSTCVLPDVYDPPEQWICLKKNGLNCNINQLFL